MIYAHIENLIDYALANKLIDGRDTVWARNALLGILHLPAAGKTRCSRRAAAKTPQYPAEILADISFWAAENNLLPADTATYREIFETSLMAVFTRRPSETEARFFHIYKKSGSRKATDWFYKYCQQVYYVKADCAAKNIVWRTQTGFGPLQLAINLAKPEKDPKEIALQSKTPAVNNGYPRCLLCVENEGYYGRLNHPPRQNLRLLPLKLNGADWYFQYSPYVYYNEHSIILSAEHKPMQITGGTFKTLLDFVRMFPHYFIGSNADLPLVGGSILNHEHYQAGRCALPIEKAASVKNFKVKKFPQVSFDIIRWPMSALRLRGGKNDVEEAAAYVFETWRKYGDAQAGITPHSGGKQHNTVTPLARFKKGKYELDIILRNNRTTAARPYGLFNTSPFYHNIKRENIGLLETAGLAVLPGRLKNEIAQITALIQRGKIEKMKDLSSLAQHYEWVKAFLPEYEKEGYKQSDVPAIIAGEIGLAFCKILYDCAVFKHDAAGKEAFLRFINKL